MIVHAHEGTALEVFWRYRGTATWSYLTALRFLLRLRLGSDGIRSLKGLLAERVMLQATYGACRPMKLSSEPPGSSALVD